MTIWKGPRWPLTALTINSSFFLGTPFRIYLQPAETPNNDENQDKVFSIETFGTLHSQPNDHEWSPEGAFKKGCLKSWNPIHQILELMLFLIIFPTLWWTKIAIENGHL